MAQRRMFSKEITNSSDFLMMSQSAQSLYFHIGMNADDDGFCEVFTVMRMTDSKPDDLSVLHAKGFIFVHDSKVCIVKDWHKNNLIRKDRYSPSKYLENDNLKEIYFTIMDEKVRKLEQYSNIKVNGKPVVNQRLPQYSIGKDSIGKNILSSNADARQQNNTSVKKRSEAQQVIDYWIEKYTNTFGDSPVVSWGKVIKLANPKVNQLGLDRMKLIVDRYFVCDDEIVKRNKWDVGTMLSDFMINKLK